MTLGPRPRGFLSNYPADVIIVVNDHPITKGDILQAKRERQARELAAKRRDRDPTVKPCFIWVFYTQGLGGWAYCGWWLYVKTLHQSWTINKNGNLTLKIMRLYPCGYLPMIENFEPWMAAFAAAYHRETLDGQWLQGVVVARAEFSRNGQLLDIKRR